MVVVEAAAATEVVAVVVLSTATRNGIHKLPSAHDYYGLQTAADP